MIYPCNAREYWNYIYNFSTLYVLSDSICLFIQHSSYVSCRNACKYRYIHVSYVRKDICHPSGPKPAKYYTFCYFDNMWKKISGPLIHITESYLSWRDNNIVSDLRGGEVASGAPKIVKLNIFHVHVHVHVDASSSESSIPIIVTSRQNSKMFRL